VCQVVSTVRSFKFIIIKVGYDFKIRLATRQHHRHFDLVCQSGASKFNTEVAVRVN
jgi:hypothetical protein